MIGHQVLLYQIEHRVVHHLAQHHEGVVEVVAAGQDLPVHRGGALRLVGLDLGDGAGLHAPGMIDEVLGVHPELAVEHVRIHLGHALQIEHPVLREPPSNARPDVPNVGDGPMPPDALAKGARIELAHPIRRVLGRDVERHLREEQVGADAHGGRDARLRAHRRAQGVGELAGRQVVQLQIGRGVDEALVDGIRMDVLLGHIAQVGAVDLRRHLHVARHARLGRDVVDPLGNLVEPAAVFHPRRLHGRAHRQANSHLRARRIGHHQPRRHGIQPPAHALHRGVKALQIDTDICALTFHAAQYNMERSFASY